MPIEWAAVAEALLVCTPAHRAWLSGYLQGLMMDDPPCPQMESDGLRDGNEAAPQVNRAGQCDDWDFNCYRKSGWLGAPEV